MAPTTFDTGYNQNPWSTIETKTRPFYVPQLQMLYQRDSVYNRFVNVKFNMNGLGATEMYIDSPILPHPNNDPLGVRDLWMDSSYMDSLRRKITFSRQGGKLSYNRYDD